LNRHSDQILKNLPSLELEIQFQLTKEEEKIKVEKEKKMNAPQIV